MELPSQIAPISKEPETNGFDLSTGNTWIYPENYPIREYQYNIVQTALYHNSLVCLPTGLGKTFIAAVIMYNFWRWFPSGKIVFLAPTKPLVAQQIDACYNIMGIPNADTIELTGAVNQKNREIAWFKKRVIFATPQVFHNDLEKSIVPNHLIKCVVIDEAHKALGKHSYCECIRILSSRNQYFRILALSATPGNKIDNVYEVIQNLCISHLELRDENSADIVPYINKRKIDTILVPLNNELAQFKERYIIIMDRHVKVLMQYNILRGNTANISKGRIFHLLNEYRAKTNKSGNHAQIMKTLTILLTMYHAYELMIRHGLRAFCKFYQNHSDKFWMNSENQLRQLLHEIETYLGPFPNIFPNGDVSETSSSIVFGHNKFYKLKELLEHHFRKNNEDTDTRAIVFVEYRDIVNEVYILLLQSKPLIRPQMFVGQASQKQKQQIKALEDFRSNRVNVLISTSIGEEGLDVGEVDLIVCFDVSQHSPIRLVQRMGRTGRKRDGHIIILVTDGKEYENLKSTLSRRNSINNKILNTSNIFASLYQNNPRMIPSQFSPKCHKMNIVILPKAPTVKGRRKRKNDNQKNEVFSTKQKETTSKNAGQSLMMKFLTNNICTQQDNSRNTLTLTTQSSNVHNTIDPKNVKLLSDDIAGIDFLTLCAVKKSEEEMSSKTIRKMDTTYIPVAKPAKDPYNFVVPNVQVLDTLPLLITNLINQLSIKCDDRENKNTQNDDDYINIIEDDTIWCTIRDRRNVDTNVDTDVNTNVDINVDTNIGTNEVRFEDILDDTSNSNITIMSHVSRAFSEVDPVDIREVASSSTKNNIETKPDYIETGLSNNLLDDVEPSMFEDILNDSFSSTDDDAANTVQQNIVPSKLSNVLSKNIDDTNAAFDSSADESLADIFLDDTNVDDDNQNVSEPAELMKPDQTDKSIKNDIDKMQGDNLQKSYVDEIQDFYFDDDFDTVEFTRDEVEKSKPTHNSKPEESYLSITQIIGEIARKKNLEESPRLSINKGDSSPEWISTRTKPKTEVGKKNVCLRLESKLFNANVGSATKSNTARQHFDLQDDSDEDFVITDDSVKKFDELESSYFRDTSKSSKNKINYLPNTLKAPVSSSNHFNNTANSFAAGSSSFCSTSKIMKPPLDAASSIDNRRPLLSLKRNKESNAIDLSAFKAPSKCINRETNILKSDVGTSKQIPLLDRKDARKTSREHNKRKRPKNEFINDEANVSLCELTSSGSDESTTMDEDLQDFVSYTQHVEDQVDMQAHYLQTVRSPIKKPGAFHFKKPQPLDPDIEIYSQPLSPTQDSYLNDTFCVDEDDEPSILDNDSILEIAERKLERNKRKRPLSKTSARQWKKKKNVNILNKSVSSEDEIEQLRLQVQNE